MNFDDMLYGMTTIIETQSGRYVSQGSGFFIVTWLQKTQQRVVNGEKLKKLG